MRIPSTSTRTGGTSPLGRRLGAPRRAVAVGLVAMALLSACSQGVGSTRVEDGGEVRSDADGTLRLLDEVPPLHPSVDGFGRGEIVLRASADGATWTLPVLLATTPEERSHGLMEVPELPAGTGMAFVFPELVQGGFWMKDTLVPLDIAYVAGTDVVSTTSMVPCTADPCPSHPAEAPYDLALEVPAGFFARIGLDATWTVELRA